MGHENVFLVMMGILISPLVIHAVYYAYLHWPIVIEGAVDHKRVVGVKDGVVFDILEVAPHGVWFSDKEIMPFLNNTSFDLYNFTLDGLIEVIKSRYDEYTVRSQLGLSTKI